MPNADSTAGSGHDQPAPVQARQTAAGPNISHSVLSRLQNEAQKSGESYNQVLQMYVTERLLARLAESPHAGEFTLKGGYLVRHLVSGRGRRTTMDCDLLGPSGAPHDQVRATFREIAARTAGADGVIFDPNSLDASALTGGQAGNGLRIRLTCRIGQAKLVAQADIGFDNAVTPPPERTEIPSLLKHLPPIQMAAYPASVIIAEKYQAIVQLGMRNSRLRDFYDIAALARTKAFAGTELCASIGATFSDRDTPVPSDPPIGFTKAYVETNAIPWRSFAKANPSAGPLAEVVDEAWKFLAEPSSAIRHGRTFTQRWDPSQWTWGHAHDERLPEPA